MPWIALQDAAGRRLDQALCGTLEAPSAMPALSQASAAAGAFEDTTPVYAVPLKIGIAKEAFAAIRGIGRYTLIRKDELTGGETFVFQAAPAIWASSSRVVSNAGCCVLTDTLRGPQYAHMTFLYRLAADYTTGEGEEGAELSVTLPNIPADWSLRILTGGEETAAVDKSQSAIPKLYVSSPEATAFRMGPDSEGDELAFRIGMKIGSGAETLRPADFAAELALADAIGTLADNTYSLRVLVREPGVAADVSSPRFDLVVDTKPPAFTAFALDISGAATKRDVLLKTMSASDPAPASGLKGYYVWNAKRGTSGRPLEIIVFSATLSPEQKARLVSGEACMPVPSAGKTWTLGTAVEGQCRVLASAVDNAGNESAVREIGLSVSYTTSGRLSASETWIVDTELTGSLIVPAGVILTIAANVNVRIAGDPEPQAGRPAGPGGSHAIIVEPGGVLILNAGSSISGPEGEAWRWAGILVYGQAAITGARVRNAVQGTLAAPGSTVAVSGAEYRSCRTGLHAVGANPSVTGAAFEGSERYGVKEDASAAPVLRDRRFTGNAIDYYAESEGRTAITMTELNALRAGNSGNSH